MVSCVIPGQANIPLETSKERKIKPSTDPESKDVMLSHKFLRDEVFASSKKLALPAYFDFGCIDTDNAIFVETDRAREIATTAHGSRQTLPFLNKTDLSSVAHTAIKFSNDRRNIVDHNNILSQ